MSVLEAKRNFVVDEAVRLFLEKSISSVTIREIAQAAGVGEATLYRWFSGRSGLVIACALRLQTEVGRAFLAAERGANGYRRLEQFYGAYSAAFLNRPELYRFLSEFDAYCISESLTALDEYEDNMDRFKAVWLSAYEDGLKDGTVRPLEDPGLFYYATTHAVLSLCKKLAAERGVIRQDQLTDKAAEVRVLIGVILRSLKTGAY